MTPPTDSAMLDLTWSCCNYTGWDLNGQCMITLSTASNATECLVSVPWARSIPSKFVDCRYIECIIHWDPIPFIIVNKLNRTQFISDKAYLDKDITDYDDWRSPRFACVERMLRAKTFHSTLVFFCLDDAFVPNQQSSINTSSNHPQSTSINVNQHRSANKRNHGTLFIKKMTLRHLLYKVVLDAMPPCVRNTTLLTLSQRVRRVPGVTWAFLMFSSLGRWRGCIFFNNQLVGGQPTIYW